MIILFTASGLPGYRRKTAGKSEMNTEIKRVLIIEMNAETNTETRK